MAEYTAEVRWTRDGQDFLGNRYSRKHLVRFDGGAELAGSSSPHVVAVPMSDPAAVDPEEMFIASIASCHMLWFFSMAVKAKFRVDSYADSATGVMEKNQAGKLAVSVVTLRPNVRFGGDRLPTRDQIDDMHHAAHEECFIANSVKTEIRVEPIGIA